ncbi:MAG: hypothetical protein ACTSSP_04620 [Candidatus Asgardarchaeia archaeon]
MKIGSTVTLILGFLLLIVAAFDFTVGIVTIPRYLFGVISLFLIVVIVVLLYLERRMEKVISAEVPSIEEMKEAARGRKAALSIIPEGVFEVYKPAKLHIKMKNVTGSRGMRIYFSSLDYVNPNNIILWLEPDEKQDIILRVIPVGKGERELAIEVRPLFDENGNLIPEADADPISFQSFKYNAKERMVGGLTSTQRSIIKNIAKVAAIFTVISGALFAYFPELVASAEIITSFVPLFITLQVPLLYIYFYLVNRLPIS